MSPAAAAIRSRRAAVTARLASRGLAPRRPHTMLRGDIVGHPARPVVLAVAGMVVAAAVAIGLDAAWIVMLLVGIGLGAVGTTRRRAVRDGLAHARVENELRLHIRELRESRARVSQVADAERRRIERDLHDGCQQQLIALRVKLSLAEELVSGDDSALELIHQISEDAESALEDLHALVHGIYPSILLDRGLAAALKAIGRSAPMPVRVLADGTSRYPADVEAAVYFACAEALQNTAKHAGTGATARIALSHDGSGLAFEVRDDGRGFADHVNAGSGLANMKDRLSAIGGRLQVTSAPGCGTSVQGWVGEVEPLDSAASMRSTSGASLRT